MADTSQGDGWWIASDERWYPPQLHADSEHRERYAPAAIPPVPPPAPVRPGASSQKSGHVGGTRSRVWLWLAGAVVAAGVLVPVLILTLGSSSDTDPSGAADVEVPEQDEEISDEPAEEPTSTGDSDQPVTDPEDGGTTADPIGFGQTYVWENWRTAVVDAIDPEEAGLLAEFSDPPGVGNAFVAVLYDITYTGPDIGASIPLFVTLTGFDSFDSFGCFLDPETLAEQGLEPFAFEVVPGQTVHIAECFEIQADQADSVVVSIENFDQFGPEVVFARGGTDLPHPGPVNASPDYGALTTLDFGAPAEWEDWSATITGTADAKQAGLLNTFASDPREAFSYIAVTYEVSYNGTNATEFNPLQLSALGSAVYDSFGDCFLSPDLLEDIGIESIYELERDQSATLAACIEIPDDEVDSVIFRLANPFNFLTDEPFYYRQS